PPSLLAPSALLRRASSLVSPGSAAACARWPAPPAADWGGSRWLTVQGGLYRFLAHYATANANICGIRGLPRYAALSGGWAPGLPVLIYQVSHAAAARYCGARQHAGWETADRYVHRECAARRSAG